MRTLKKGSRKKRWFFSESEPAAQDGFMTGEAELLSEEIIPDDGIDGTVKLDRARNLRLQGDFTGAVSEYKTILDQNHGRDVCAAALLGIAGVKADSGFADEAAVWCERAIELDRIDPGAHFLLGQICLQRGRMTEPLLKCEMRFF